jgi:hypothetical protein
MPQIEELIAYMILYFANLTVIALLLWVVVYHLFLSDNENNKEIEKHFRK